MLQELFQVRKVNGDSTPSFDVYLPGFDVFVMVTVFCKNVKYCALFRWRLEWVKMGSCCLKVR